MQKTITINGIKLTAFAIRNAEQTPATGGHLIASTKAGEVHWIDWNGEVHVLNAGSVRKNAAFGAKIAFLS